MPKPYESMTRYYGWYSCRARGERRKREIQALPEVAPEPRRGPSPTWAQCIKRVYEIDPLECPKCNGKMRIIAFVQDTAEIKKIMHALGLPDYTAPPPIPRPSNFEEHLFVNDIPDYD